jgi:hypothetical protein
MTGGYLARVVESGMTSVGDVRGSIPGTHTERNSEEQLEASPFARDERGDSEPTHAISKPRSEAHMAPRSPALGLAQDATVQPDVNSDRTPALPVPSLAPPDVDAALPTRPPDTRIEERWSSEIVSAAPQQVKRTGADAPLLKDAGIRTVRGELSRDGPPTANGANRRPAVTFDVTVQPFDGPADGGVHQQREISRQGHSSAGEGEQRPRPPAVSASRVEEWKRLKDRLLIEHYHGGPERPSLRSSTSNEDHSASQPANVNSSSREIVIEQLEVVVAAPQPASPPPPAGPAARPPRSGAWSVATRRYLGKL